MVGFLEVFGYRAPETPLGWNLSPKAQQLISSLMTLGAVIASACVGLVASKLGRKACMWIACVLCMVSNVIMMATTNLAGLYAGRLLIGLSNGMMMTFSQLYLQECTPARFRGMALSAFQFWTSSGSLIGTIVDNYTAPIEGKPSYLIPLGLIYILPCFMIVGLFFVPESPRWLMEQGKPEAARKALGWLRPYEEGLDQEIATIQAAIEEDVARKDKALLLEMWRNPIDRRRTILAICAVNTQAASGAMYMIAFTQYFLGMAGVANPFENSVILSAVGVTAIIINTCIITRWGRRRVFMTTGLILCGTTQLILAVVYDLRPDEESTMNLIVGLSVIYIFGYNGMISAYAWLSGGEIPSQRLRSWTFGIASSLGFLGAWLATFTAPYFINPDAMDWGPKYGYIWAPSCLIAAAWVYIFLPEVKGRSLEEIDEMFAERLPAKKFRKYECTGTAALESKMRGGGRGSGSDAGGGGEEKGPTTTAIERAFDEHNTPQVATETAITKI